MFKKGDKVICVRGLLQDTYKLVEGAVYTVNWSSAAITDLVAEDSDRVGATRWKTDRFKLYEDPVVLPITPPKEPPMMPPFTRDNLPKVGDQVVANLSKKYGDYGIKEGEAYTVAHVDAFNLTTAEKTGPINNIWGLQNFSPLPIIMPTTTEKPQMKPKFQINDTVIATNLPGGFRIQNNTRYEVRGYDSDGLVLLKGFPHGYKEHRFTLVTPANVAQETNMNTATKPAAPVKKEEEVKTFYIACQTPARNKNFTGTETQARAEAEALLRVVGGEVFITLMVGKVKLGEKPAIWE